jgi:polyhydroxybutyrate depolymerase
VIRLIPLACAAILAFSLACSSSGSGAPPESATEAPVIDATPTPVTCAPARALTPGETTVTMQSGGIDRSYILHIPPGYTGEEQTPLVLVFHGYSMGNRLMLDVTGFGKAADADGFVVAAPLGLGDPPAWPGIPPLPGASDVPFVKAMLAKLKSDLCIDPDRVFAAGYSNGGGMAQLLACEMPDQIAAIGAVAALYTNCAPHAPVIAFHGTLDPVLPFDGGDIGASPGDDNRPPVRRSVSEWAVSLGCDGLAGISKLSANIELSTYHNCTAGDGEALLYTVIGGGHTWPGAAIDLPAQFVGQTSHEIDATALMWQFFTAHSLVH